MVKRATISTSLAETERCQQVWGEFCKLETDLGGPDSHMPLVGDLSRDLPVEEQAWRAVCYIAPYVVSTAGVIWTTWPIERAVKDLDSFGAWVVESFPRLPMRRERRAARSPAKLSRALVSGAKWAHDVYPLLAMQETTYQEAWDSVAKHVYSFGRYATIKLLETLHRYAGLEASLQDIRPAGAWSPRLTLSYLYPEHDAILNNKRANDEFSLLEVMELAAEAKDLADLETAKPLSWFQLEVLLCNLRQMMERKYPGYSHDSELAYYYQTTSKWDKAWFDQNVDLTGARERCFNARCLGELNDWSGKREELEDTYRVHGYLWSDLLYDYHASKGDLAHPKRWVIDTEDAELEALIA